MKNRAIFACLVLTAGIAVAGQVRSAPMKLLSFSVSGRDLFGAVSGDGVVTLNDKVGQPDLAAALGAGGIEALRQAARGAKADHKLADIKFRPVIPQPNKILCAGVNYRAHAAEGSRELPKQPSMFIRFTDTLVGHGGDMVRPKLSDNFDYEGELALVIGKAGRHIPPRSRARPCRGLHDLRRRLGPRLSKILRHLGQELARHWPARPVARHHRRNSDPSKLVLTTRLNGQQVQHSGTDKLMYSIPQIISFCSDFTACRRATSSPPARPKASATAASRRYG